MGSSFFQFLKNRKLWIVPPLLIGVAAILLAPMLKSKPAQVEVQERATKVRAIKITPMAVVPRAVGYGTVASGRTWDAVAEVAGQVAWVSDELKNGRTVPAGTELLLIEDADYRLALAQIEAQIKSADVKDKTTRTSLAIAEKDFKLVKADYERKKGLAAKGAVSKTSVETAERQILNAQSQVQNLRNTQELNAVERLALVAQKASAELNLQRTHMIAPFDVRITDVKIGQAQYANKGQQLFTGDGIDVAEIEAQFPIGILRPLIRAVTQNRAETQEGLMALSAMVRLRTATHEVEWPARIDRATGAIDPQTQSLGVVVAIDKPTEQASPGKRPRLLRNTFVEVELIAPALEKQIVVPLSSLHNGKIYVVDEENRLAIRKVKVSFSQMGFAILKSGIKPGEQIVTSDLPSALEGMLLAPQDDKKTKRKMVTEATGKEPQK
ncbi:MAG: efflux RND transporter periplasmic adaptor subunit [Rhodospirillales bacterium]|nr:efflux RND transporter periplasmic adaptor subunit [Rhodospirillales bacterium]